MILVTLSRKSVLGWLLLWLLRLLHLAHQVSIFDALREDCGIVVEPITRILAIDLGNGRVVKLFPGCRSCSGQGSSSLDPVSQSILLKHTINRDWFYWAGESTRWRDAASLCIWIKVSTNRWDPRFKSIVSSVLWSISLCCILEWLRWCYLSTKVKSHCWTCCFGCRGHFWAWSSCHLRLQYHLFTSWHPSYISQNRLVEFIWGDLALTVNFCACLLVWRFANRLLLPMML